MHFWTFIIEDGHGSTLISQVHANDVDSTIVAYNTSAHAKEYDIVFPSRDNSEKYVDWHHPVKITGIRNVWYVPSPDDADVMFVANVIKTQP